MYNFLKFRYMQVLAFFVSLVFMLPYASYSQESTEIPSYIIESQDRVVIPVYPDPKLKYQWTTFSKEPPYGFGVWLDEPIIHNFGFEELEVVMEFWDKSSALQYLSGEMDEAMRARGAIIYEILVLELPPRFGTYMWLPDEGRFEKMY